MLPITLSAAVGAWLEFKSKAWTNPRTGDSYQLAVRGWIEALGPDRVLEELGPIEVQALYLKRNNGRRSGSWLDRERQLLAGFFRWALDMGLLKRSPLNRTSWPRLGSKKRSARSRVHLRIDGGLLERIIDLAPIRYHRLFIFLYLTGCRISESWEALWRWIEQDPRYPEAWILRIPGDAQKNRSESVKIIGGNLKRILGEPGKPEERIFAEVPSVEAAKKMLERIGKKLGIPHLGCHQFRRAYSTALLLRGVPLPAVAQQIGWRSPPRGTFELLRESYFLGLEGDELRRTTDELWNPQERNPE